jgi:hypothetical protein
MPLHASSYFAGVGTVVAMVALGFGAGVLMTDALVGKSENPPTLTERRAMSESTVPLVTAAQNAPVAAGTETQAAPPAPAPAQQAERELQPRPEQAMARAQEADIKAQKAEAKKAMAAERRKEERRKWADRRKREQRIEDMNAVAERVRQAERQREPVVRSFFAESPPFKLFEDDQ